MTLEFQKLTSQVDRMGQYFAEQRDDDNSKVELALQILAAHSPAEYLPYILQRVQDAVDKDAGYRGARPLDEPIGDAYPPAPLPQGATVIATDGSQKYPDRHGAVTYYLLNIGTIVVHYGSGQPPEVSSDPYLFFEEEYTRSQDGGAISAVTVNARRTVNEMTALAEYAWRRRGEARPLVALLDGPLLLPPMGIEIPDREQLRILYLSAMTRLLEVKAALAGYIDKPDSSFVVRLLHLLDIPIEEVSRNNLALSGRLEGLRDSHVFRRLLGPGERTAIFVQMSPQNKEFRRTGGPDHEIAFFYLNVAAPGEPAYVVRVEIPMWVARDRALIAEMQALLYHQCQQLTVRYPYVLTRADELACVKADESRQLETMIQVALTRYGLSTLESEKQAGKNAARASKVRFDVRAKSGRGK